MTDAPSPRSAPPKQAAAKPAAKPGVRPAARPAGKGKPAAKAKRTGSLRPGLLPVTIAVAVLVLGFKIGDFGMALATGKGISLIAPSIAEEKTPQGLPAATAAVAPAVAKPAATAPVNVPLQVAQAAPPAASGAAHGEHHETAPAAAPAPSVQTGEPAPSGAPGQTFSPTELELLQRLQERRSQLETRAGELDLREAMLTAAEQRFDQKIAELQNLKKEIQGLLTQANAEQQAQLESLVKIYETMKPADAAKIFNSLENDVLLNVISRMKEAKVAPVFAAMDEKRAQEVTILLAARKRLPTVPD